MFKPISDDVLVALDEAHNDIRVVKGATPPAKSYRPNVAPETPWQAVFRKPTQGESDAFEGAAHNDKAKPGALRNFAKALVCAVNLDGKVTMYTDRTDLKAVRETRDAWEALRARFGGAHMAAQEDLMDLMGATKDEGGKE